MKQHYEFNLDFDLLRDQKNALAEIVMDDKNTLLEGILSLLDEIEDQAIEKGYLNEEE
jgi:hypothetical protein